MRIRLLCVGKLKDGPERLLLDDYLLRARKMGAGLGYKGPDEIEMESGGGREKECARLLSRLTAPTCICLDEHAAPSTSSELSRRLTQWRDSGADVDFVIGGADGLTPEILSRSTLKLSFGSQTWPHKLVRAMLAEQIYRALSIQTGSPYHRE